MFATIQATEVLWLAAALPGLALWQSNMRYAMRSRALLRRAKVTNGRMVWARFSVLLTSTFTTIETGFVLIGVISMTTEPPPTSSILTRWVVAGVLIAMSFLITYIAMKWKLVDTTLNKLASGDNG